MSFDFIELYNVKCDTSRDRVELSNSAGMPDCWGPKTLGGWHPAAEALKATAKSLFWKKNETARGSFFFIRCA